MTHVPDLLIALNAAPGLSRPAVCRLAREIDRWAGAPGSTASTRPGPVEIGVPRAALDRALALAARPDQAAETAARERQAAAELGAAVVTAADAGYPACLEHLALPPPVLYIQGELPQGLAVAIVGSRKADAYGQEVAELFARGLAEAGVTVVSGFARGIDAAAHRGALAAPDGRTVAVLGCGLGIDYPAGQGRLGRDIAGRGARLSELPCEAPPRAWHFPVRNRLIAALSAGILVVQAAPRSGSLVTARHALDLGREIWAVPGRIFDERSLGPNALIRDGASLVQHPREILESLEILPGLASSTREPALPADTGPEPPAGFPGQVFAALPRGGGRAAEEVAAELGAPVDQVLGALLELELLGRVKRLPGSAYGR